MRARPAAAQHPAGHATASAYGHRHHRHTATHGACNRRSFRRVNVEITESNDATAINSGPDPAPAYIRAELVSGGNTGN
jgi:hypothetical protein